MLDARRDRYRIGVTTMCASGGRKPFVYAVLALAASATACTANLGKKSEKPDVPGQSSGGSSSVVPEVTPAQCAEAATDPGPSPLRRLTRDEYNYTVHDLLGDTTAPGSSFPGEELAFNFPNNADVQTVSSLLIEGYETAAIELSTAAVTDLPALLGCDPVATGEDACVQSFLTNFGLKTYRHPLDADEIDSLFAFYTTTKSNRDFPTAVRLTLQAMLQSPRFLYRVEALGTEAVTRLTGHEVATRLSYLLWSSMPDSMLLDAAANGGLDTNEGVAQQAQRLLQDPRANQAVVSFFESWLDLQRLKHSDAKDPDVFPTFTADLVPLLRQESDLFVSDVFFNGGDLKTLFLGNYTFMNKPLADYYGMTGPAGDAFERVTLDATKYAGFLTQAGVLAGLGKVNETSPVQRGFFVRERLLCNPPDPPPANIPSLRPPDPTLTTRARLAEHREAAACAGCHNLMDPIGFGFEHFDGAGLWRDTENGLTIDATGELTNTDVDGTFDGALELATRLAESPQAEACAVLQWFRFGYGRGESAADGCNLLRLETAFSDAGGNFQALVLALTQSDAFLYRTNELGASE
jgi:hypothetical protein